MGVTEQPGIIIYLRLWASFPNTEVCVKISKEKISPIRKIGKEYGQIIYKKDKKILLYMKRCSPHT